MSEAYLTGQATPLQLGLTALMATVLMFHYLADALLWRRSDPDMVRIVGKEERAPLRLGEGGKGKGR